MMRFAVLLFVLALFSVGICTDAFAPGVVPSSSSSSRLSLQQQQQHRQQLLPLASILRRRDDHDRFASSSLQQQSSRLVPFHRSTSSSSTTVLYMAWGPEPIWSPAQVLSIQDACVSGKSVTIMVQVSPETAAAYTIPGQYVQLRQAPPPIAAAAASDTTTEGTSFVVQDTPPPISTKPLFLAIASPPNPDVTQFEFLIKRTEDNAWLTSSSSTTASTTTSSFPAIEISQILGNGFAITEHLDGFLYDFPTQNVLLFAAGSGLAPIKAALESTALRIAPPGQGGRTCRLYYGEQTPDDLCFVTKFSTWEAQGIQVVPVISQVMLEEEEDGHDASSNNHWQGRTGYVQNALEEDGVAIPRNSAALLCGMKGMVESVTAILTKAGVFSGRVLTNF